MNKCSALSGATSALRGAQSKRDQRSSLIAIVEIASPLATLLLAMTDKLFTGWSTYDYPAKIYSL